MKRFTAFQNIPEPGAIHASFSPYYEFDWPEDLPSRCGICGSEFRVRINLQFGPRRNSRILRKISIISLLTAVLAFLFVVASLASLAILNFDNSFVGTAIILITTLGFILLIAAPVMFFISIFTPDVRHLVCKQCGWSQDYPLLKTDLKLPKQDSI